MAAEGLQAKVAVLDGPRRVVRLVFLRPRLARWVFWRGCQLLGLLRRLVVSGRRKLFTMLAIAAGLVVAAWLLDWHVGWKHNLVGKHGLVGGLGETLGTLVGIWLLGSFLLVLWQARRRVVVEQFTDWTESEQKPDPRGLATLLVGEIAGLRALYWTVDRRAIATAVQASRPLDATIRVEDVSEFLESTATTESKVSVGPIQIPMGIVLAFFGRLVRGPRLVGGVHVEGGNVVLSAQLSQSGVLHAWRVERPLPAGRPAARVDVPHKMVEELGCRMFTELALGGPVRWQATEAFTDALAAIRMCLRTRRNRRGNLRQAEHCLIRALAEDEQLAYIHYNLGVVYTELRRLADQEQKEHADDTRAAFASKTACASAERAFRCQIELMPERWEAYYALALTYCESTPPRLDDLLPHCDRVVEMHPGRSNTAKALLLRGATESKLGDLRQSRRDRREAVAEAWSGLGWAALRGGETEEEVALAAQALLDLALTYRDRPLLKKRRLEWYRKWRDYRTARALLIRAGKLTPHRATIHFELGRLYRSRDLDRAIAEFEQAQRIDPARAKYWAYLALVRAQSARTAKDEHARLLDAKHAAVRALELIDCSQLGDDLTKTLEKVAATHEELAAKDFKTYREFAGSGAEAERVKKMSPFFDTCRRLVREQDVPGLLELTKDVAGSWEWAHIFCALGEIMLLEKHFGAAREFLGEAILSFEEAYSAEIGRRDLRILLARALQGQAAKLLDDGGRRDAEKLNERAIRELRLAVGDEPLRSREREALAEAYTANGDYEQARVLLEEALLWDPDHAALHRKLGSCYWRLAEDRQAPEQRKEALQEAIRSFEQALELSGSDDPDEQFQAHYWLARLHKELGEYDQAVPHLRRTTGFPQGKGLVRVLLGEAYVRGRAYRSADPELSEAIALLELSDGVDLGEHFDDKGWPSTRLRAYAHSLLGFAYAQQGFLAPARDEIRSARRAIEEGSLETDISKAAADDAEGLIQLKENALDRAVELFESSVALLPDSETYLRLAEACLRQAARSDANGSEWVRRGRDACRRAMSLDMTQRVSDEARGLLQEFSVSQRL